MIQEWLIWRLYDLHRPEIADLSGDTLPVEYSAANSLGVVEPPLQKWLEQLTGTGHLASRFANQTSEALEEVRRAAREGSLL